MQTSLKKSQNVQEKSNKSVTRSVTVELSPVESYRLRKYAELNNLTLEQALFRALGGCVPTSSGCVPTCEAIVSLSL